MNMIDKIKAELVRRIEVGKIDKANGYPECDGGIIECEGMLSFIDDLFHQTSNDDEFDAYYEIYQKEYSKGEYCHETSFKWGFEEGSRWRQGLMMENAVEGVVGKTQGWRDGGKNNPNLQVRATIPPEGFTYGEKVKVIIIKD